MTSRQRPSLLVFAFGVAVIAATLRAMQTGWWSFADMGWTVVAFCLSYGGSLLVGWGALSAPVAVAEMWSDMHENLARARGFSLTAPATPPAPTAGAVTGPLYAEEWTAYWLGWARYCRDKGAITFSATSEYYGSNAAASHATWTAILRPLQHEGLVMPIEKGQTTRLAPTVTLGALVGRFERGLGVKAEYVPSYEPPRPFEALGEGIGNKSEEA